MIKTRAKYNSVFPSTSASATVHYEIFSPDIDNNYGFYLSNNASGMDVNEAEIPHWLKVDSQETNGNGPAHRNGIPQLNKIKISQQQKSTVVLPEYKKNGQKDDTSKENQIMVFFRIIFLAVYIVGAMFLGYFIEFSPFVIYLTGIIPAWAIFIVFRDFLRPSGTPGLPPLVLAIFWPIVMVILFLIFFISGMGKLLGEPN